MCLVLVRVQCPYIIKVFTHRLLVSELFWAAKGLLKVCCTTRCIFDFGVGRMGVCMANRAHYDIMYIYIYIYNYTLSLCNLYTIISV